MGHFVRTSKGIWLGCMQATKGGWRWCPWPKKLGQFSSTSPPCWPGWKSSLGVGSVLSGCGWRWRRTESLIGTLFLWSLWEEHLGETQDWSCGSHQGCTWGIKVTKYLFTLKADIALPLTSSLLQCGGFLFVPQSWYWPKCRCLACLYGWIWIENRETYWACLWSEVVLQQENLSGRRSQGCPLASRGRQRQHCQQVDSGQGCTLQSDSSPQMSNRVRNYVF